MLTRPGVEWSVYLGVFEDRKGAFPVFLADAIHQAIVARNARIQMAFTKKEIEDFNLFEPGVPEWEKPGRGPTFRTPFWTDGDVDLGEDHLEAILKYRTEMAPGKCGS